MKWSILISLLMVSLNIYGQLNIRYELDTIHSKPRTMFYSFQEKDDTLYIIGERKIDVNNNNIFYLKSFFIKVDKYGNVIDYVESDYSVRNSGHLILSSDNNLVFAATDYYANLPLFKYSLDLDSIWVNYLNFPMPNIYLEGRDLIETSDKNFLILGKQYDNNNNTSKEYIIKTDSIGNEIWRRGYNMPLGVGYWCTPTAVFEASDGNYVALQAIRRYSLSFPTYEEVTSIEKIDTSGNQIWEYKTAVNRIISVYDGVQTADNGIIFCGVEGEKVHAAVLYQGHLRKIDSLQQVEWEYTLGNHENSILQDIEKLSDGNYLATGYDVITFPDTALINYADSSHGTGWLIKFTSDGTILWQRRHMKYNSFPVAQYLNETHELSNGDLVSVGYHFTDISPNSGYWGWLIRTDSFGCIVPGCQLLDNTENISVLFDNEVTVFPNPASEVVRFRFDKAIEEQTEILVYSGLGQLVGQTALPLPQTEAEINVSDWNNGVYYYGVYMENVLVKQGQILIEN